MKCAIGCIAIRWFPIQSHRNSVAASKAHRRLIFSMRMSMSAVMMMCMCAVVKNINTVIWPWLIRVLQFYWHWAMIWVGWIAGLSLMGWRLFNNQTVASVQRLRAMNMICDLCSVHRLFAICWTIGAKSISSWWLIILKNLLWVSHCGYNFASITLSTKYLIECYLPFLQRYDYGISQHLEMESHGGTTFCALAALYLSGQMDVLSDTVKDKMTRWLMFRQDGGFNGRPNKATDSCYSFWIPAAMRILDAFQYTDFALNREWVFAIFSRISWWNLLMMIVHFIHRSKQIHSINWRHKNRRLFQMARFIAGSISHILQPMRSKLHQRTRSKCGCA